MPSRDSAASREDIENQLRAVHHAASENLLQVAALRRRQLVVEDDDVDVRFGERAGEFFGLAAADERRRIGPRTLLHRAQHGLGARGLGQAGELFENQFGIGSARRGRDEADECGTLGRWPGSTHPADCHACNDSNTRSHAIAPARMRRGSRRTSTMVEGGPPGASPASITHTRGSRATASRSPMRATAGAPLRFALVAVSQLPNASQIPRAIACAGTRTATESRPACTAEASPGGASMMSESGPGQ